MTELTIAQSIADFVCDQLPAPEEHGPAVAKVRLKIGVLCGASPQALKAAFRSVVVGTHLEETAIEIETADLVVWCSQCHQEQLLDDPRHVRCPVCRSRTPKIIQGNEFEITAVEWAQGVAPAGTAG